MSRPKGPPKPGPTEVAAAAHCSKSIAHRLLNRGLTKEQIIQRMDERRARQAELAGLPLTPVANMAANGHAANQGLATFAEAQRLKENSLAELRALQVARVKGEVLRVEPLRAITSGVMCFQRDCLWRWPDELAGDLAMRSQLECAMVLRRHVESLFSATDAYVHAEYRKYGLPTPPPPPPRPAPSKLPYYEQYVKDSVTGQREHIGGATEIGSPEWLTLHPSIDFQKSFEISRKKREWDAAMASLLNSRAEWDLPAEVLPPPPPPPEPEGDVV